MREVLDCAVLFTPGHESGMQTFMEASAPYLGRIRLHEQRLCADTAQPANTTAIDAHALWRVALALKRFDCCLLPVGAASLSWTRMALHNAQAVLSTPILALAHDMRAPAIEDLFRLGIADFVSHGSSADEMRVRLNRLAEMPREVAHAPAPLLEATMAYGPFGAIAAASPILRPRVSRTYIDEELLRMQAPRAAATVEPFRAAKARLVDGFEREYVRRALIRHCGNVAQAARASHKHRRAFWALMRKHSIDAAPFRGRLQLDDPLSLTDERQV